MTNEEIDMSTEMQEQSASGDDRRQLMQDRTDARAQLAAALDLLREVVQKTPLLRDDSGRATCAHCGATSGLLIEGRSHTLGCFVTRVTAYLETVS